MAWRQEDNKPTQPITPHLFMVIIPTVACWTGEMGMKIINFDNNQST